MNKRPAVVDLHTKKPVKRGRRSPSPLDEELNAYSRMLANRLRDLHEQWVREALEEAKALRLKYPGLHTQTIEESAFTASCEADQPDFAPFWEWQQELGEWP